MSCKACMRDPCECFASAIRLVKETGPDELLEEEIMLNDNQFIQLKTLVDIKNERDAQDKKWGQQNHEMGTGSHFKTHSEVYKKTCDDAFRGKKGTWTDILLEEVYEALAEKDPMALRMELVQVAAVTVAMIECIDRRALEKIQQDRQLSLGEST